MSPADSVIGSINPSTGLHVVHTRYLDAYDAGAITNGWASNMGILMTNGGSIMLICFSRPMGSSAASASSLLQPGAVPINYAGSSSSSLSAQHGFANGLTINMLSGGGGGVQLASSSTSRNVIIAHGVLMLVAFAFLMPLGVLFARHKWLFADKKKVSRGVMQSQWVWSMRGGQV
jgi:hypothetical protein